MKTKTKVLPAFRPGRLYEYVAMVRYAKRFPEQWVMVLSDVPTATVTAIAERRHRDLQRDDGRLRAQGRNEYEDEQGRRRCDLFVRWEPKEEGHDREGHVRAAAEAAAGEGEGDRGEARGAGE